MPVKPSEGTIDDALYLLVDSISFRVIKHPEDPKEDSCESDGYRMVFYDSFLRVLMCLPIENYSEGSVIEVHPDILQSTILISREQWLSRVTAPK